jgi:ribosomal protein S12 methylthiotransferase
MKRHTSPEHIKNLVKHIRKNFKNSSIRTTFIVGFPGENEEDFQELVAFLDEYPLDRVGAFMYSTEENTLAAKIIPKISSAQKQRRLDELMTLQQMIVEEQNQRLIGKKTEVIIDKVEEKAAFGRTIWDAYEVDNETTIDATNSLKPGDIVKVKIISANAYDFKAELVK